MSLSQGKDPAHIGNVKHSVRLRSDTSGRICAKKKKKKNPSTVAMTRRHETMTQFPHQGHILRNMNRNRSEDGASLGKHAPVSSTAGETGNSIPSCYCSLCTLTVEGWVSLCNSPCVTTCYHRIKIQLTLQHDQATCTLIHHDIR